MVVVHAENPQSQRQIHGQAVIAAAVEATQQRRQVLGLADLGRGGQGPARQAPQVGGGGEQWKEGPQSGHPAAMPGPHSGENGQGLSVR